MFVRRFETRCWFLVLTLVAAGCGSSSPSSGGGSNGKGGAGVGVGGAGPGKGGAGGGGVQATGGAPGTGGLPVGSGGRAAGGAGGTPANGGSHGTAGAGGMAPGPGNASLAKACTADTDCGTGLVCLKATDKLIGNQGGPAHGYCTMNCMTQADATACVAAGGLCLDLSSAGDASVGYCLQDCKIGPTADTDPPKCQTRPDLVCAPVVDSATGDASGAVCVPLCALDSDCPTGRKCDPLEGSCVDTPHTGDPMGAHCTADAATGKSGCAGSCLSLVDENNVPSVSFCTQLCVLGAPGACNIAVGANMSVAGGTHGVCIYPSDPNADIGDIGYCTVECDTLNDCPDKTDPNPVCDATDTMSIIGHGICTWK